MIAQKTFVPLNCLIKTSKYFLFCLAFLLAYFNSEAQQNKVDSLLQELKKSKHDTTKLTLLFHLSNECDDEEITKYALPAIDLADRIITKSKDLSSKQLNVVRKQKARCINNIGYTYQLQGDFETALVYYYKSLKIQTDINDKYEIALSYNNIAVALQNLGEEQQALSYFQKSVLIQEAMGDKLGLSNSFSNIGSIYESKGEIAKALEYHFLSLKLGEEVGDKKGIAISLNCIATIYHSQGNIPKALSYYNKSIKLQEEINDKHGLIQSFGNIAAIYKDQGDVNKALELFNKSLKLSEGLGNKEGVAVALGNIGACYSELGDIKKALEYYNKSLKIEEDAGSKRGVAYNLNNIGNIYQKQGNFLLALETYLKSLKIKKEIGDKKGIAQSYISIATIYYKLSLLPDAEISLPRGKKTKYLLAYAFADSSLTISKELGFPVNIFKAERLLSKIDSVKGNFKGAYFHYKQFIIYNDSILNEGNRKASIKSQLNYEFEKKEAVMNEKQEKERAIAKEKDRFQQIVIWSVITGFLLVFVFAAFIFRTLKTTRLQKALIEEKQKEILDSIHYAKRIQRSLLPSEKYIQRNVTKLLSDNK